MKANPSMLNTLIHPLLLTLNACLFCNIIVGIYLTLERLLGIWISHRKFSLLSKTNYHYLFSHTTTLYDASGQPLIYILSLPSSCYLITARDNNRVVQILIISKATNNCLQAKFLKHNIGCLAYHIVDLFDHIICTLFPSSWSQHIIHSIFKVQIWECFLSK